MPITDLLPWKRPKKTRVPVKVGDQPDRVAVRDAEGLPSECSRWLGLSPFGAFGGRWGAFSPRMDMVEHKGGFTVTVEVPGMGRDDIHVTLSEHRLTVRGQKREEQEHRGQRSFHLRSGRTAFRRSILLPCPIEADEAEASLARGLLTISLPKAEGPGGPRRIPVRRT
ncbi:MAG: Hsp20/alpha crystallin family protein [Anaerolineae bacterium]|jgi:HSP20 family protein